MSVKVAGMEVDRELVAQVGISLAVVALFVVGLMVLTEVEGISQDATNHTLEGTIDGEFDGSTADGTVEGTFDGTFSNGIEVSLVGDVNGTVENGSVEAQFDGTISGAIDGTAEGTITNGTVDADAGTLSGDFQGSAEGETAMTLTETGGLLLVGLLALFIVVMSLAGHVIEGFKDEE